MNNYNCLPVKQKGLTVIELMVVVMIIALIATLGLVYFNNARAKARDAKRVYDIGQYAKAIKLYDLQNKHYPLDTDCGGVTCTGQLGWDKNASPNNVLKPFLKGLPADPKANGQIGGDDFFYYYNEKNLNCGGAPTVSVNRVETSNQIYRNNPCPGDGADYLIIVQ